MFCQRCGHEVQENSSYCPKCGSSLRESSSDGLKIPKLSISNIDKIYIAFISIWYIAWIIIKCSFRFNDDESLLMAIAFFAPLLFLLIKWLVRLLSKESRDRQEKTIRSFEDYSKNFDSIRIETTLNKITMKTETYCVFINKTRALIGESLSNCDLNNFEELLNDLIVVEKNGKLFIERK